MEPCKTIDKLMPALHLIIAGPYKGKTADDQDGG